MKRVYQGQKGLTRGIGRIEETWEGSTKTKDACKNHMEMHHCVKKKKQKKNNF